MTVLPDLSAQLIEAATRRLDTPRIAPPPRAARRARLGLIAVGAVLTSGTALAATGVWSPPLGDDHRPHPTISATAVPADQAATLAVLRRPQAAADRGATVRQVLRFLDRRSVDGVRTDAVRLLSTADRGYVLIPVVKGTNHTAGGQLCLFAVDVEGSGFSCFSTQQVLSGRAVLMSMQLADPTPAERAAFRKAAKEAHGKSFTVPGARPRQQGPTTLAGLMPDGVSTVQTQTASGVVRAPVAHNFFVLKVPLPRDATFAPRTGPLRWLDAAGRQIGTSASPIG